MAYIPIDDLNVYKLAMEIGEAAWACVDGWTEFPKATIGGQFCRAADSIAANISEAHGRYHYKDRRNFCFFARGSLLETKTWLRKSHNRKLISDEANKSLFKKLSDCHYLLNQYIKSIIPTPDASSGTLLREPEYPYGNVEDIDFPDTF